VLPIARKRVRQRQDQESNVFSFGYQPAAILEEKGQDYFSPARPQPTEHLLPLPQLIMAARSNLLSIWPKSDYKSGVAMTKILGRQICLVNTPDAVRHVMHIRHENFERKSPQMRRALEFLLGDGLFISDGETWKKRRPLVADIVHKTRVPEFGRPMRDVSAEFVTRWENFDANEPVNVLTQMAELTAEIIARAVFGNNLGSAAAYEVIEGFTRYQSLIDSFNLGYFLGADNGFPIIRGPRLRASVKKVNTVIDKVIEDHLAGRGDQSSMIELLLRRQARNPELGLDQTALRHEAATIFMAGHETTAATLTWVWYLLSHAPWVEEAVIGEIERVTGGAMPSIDDVPKLDWCRAVIEETLRLYPPVPILARQPREADEIDGHPIKPASLALVVPWLLHRAQDLWDAPHAFKPERFLGEQRPIPYSYIPFAIGPRICAGLNFGLSESILCLAILVQRFKVRVVEGYKVEPVCRLTLRPNNGLMVTIEKRARG